MATNPDQLYQALAERAPRYGISIRQTALDPEVPGKFDGPTITLNRDYDAAERAFYLAHSIGSVAEWSLHFERSQAVMEEVRRAKRTSGQDEARLTRAVEAYLAFENRTWELSLWLLQDLGQESFASAFTNFGRADLESMRIFHTTGKAPVWREFFAAWNEEVRRGQRSVSPFSPRPIPDFQARPIPQQEIVQEED